MSHKAIIFIAGIFVSTYVWAKPETYIIDPTHSIPRFEYSHLGLSTQQGRFEKISGQITLDRETKTGSMNVVIDATSISMGSNLFNQRIQSDDFFHVEKYPTITFQSEKFKFKDDTPISVDGKLTIKGITQFVTLKINAFKCMFHPMIRKNTCGADASTTIKRSDFYMNKYIPFVSDDITLMIPVEAIKEEEPIEETPSTGISFQ